MAQTVPVVSNSFLHFYQFQTFPQDRKIHCPFASTVKYALAEIYAAINTSVKHASLSS